MSHWLSRQLHHHPLPLHLGRIALRAAKPLPQQVVSVGHVEPPAVIRADDDAPLQFALAQRGFGVGAFVREDVERALDIEHGQLVPAGLDHPALTRRELGGSDQRNAGHGWLGEEVASG